MREKLRLLTGSVGALLTLAVPTATCRPATTITVTSTGDIGSAGICVLRDAITAADSNTTCDDAGDITDRPVKPPDFSLLSGFSASTRARPPASDEDSVSASHQGPAPEWTKNPENIAIDGSPDSSLGAG